MYFSKAILKIQKQKKYKTMNRLFRLPNEYQQHREDDLEPLIEITQLEDELCQRFKWSDKTRIEEIIHNLRATDAFRLG